MFPLFRPEIVTEQVFSHGQEAKKVQNFLLTLGVLYGKQPLNLVERNAVT